MSTAKSIDSQISRMKAGQLFSYKDIPEYAEHSGAVVKALSRKAQSDEVVRIKKGLYYKAVMGRFGAMGPKNSDIIKYFTLDGNKTVGYITGPFLYHCWGLTTQVPCEITIATSKNELEKADISGLRISTISARTKVTKNNIEILQFLDVLRSVDQVPDTSSGEVIKKLADKIRHYKSDRIKAMEKLAIDVYTPRTKALLGAFLETYRSYYSAPIRNALNPTSRYKISIPPTLLKNQGSWNLHFKK